MENEKQEINLDEVRSQTVAELKLNLKEIQKKS